MKRARRILGWLAVIAVGVGMGMSAVGQSAPAKQEDNPFPGDVPQAQKDSTLPSETPGQAPAPKPGQTSHQAPGQASGKAADAKPSSENPFPGEDANAPILPVAPVGDAGRRSSDTSVPGSGSGRAEADGDPVRSPDGGSPGGNDGFSSSSSSNGGLGQDLSERDEGPTNGTKIKTRREMLKEDLDVGGFYLEKKNWKAALDRFSSAFALDAESPEAVWGLAEAERHQQLYDKAREHYELFLSYDPDGPHGRAARKALAELGAMRSGEGAGKAGSGPGAGLGPGSE